MVVVLDVEVGVVFGIVGVDCWRWCCSVLKLPIVFLWRFRLRLVFLFGVGVHFGVDVGGGGGGGGGVGGGDVVAVITSLLLLLMMMLLMCVVSHSGGCLFQPSTRMIASLP